MRYGKFVPTISFIGFLFFSLNLADAATINEVWDNPSHLSFLNQFYFDNSFPLTAKTFYFNSQNHQASHPNQFKPLKSTEISQITHLRYAQYYYGIPVWGNQLIVHHKTNTRITGTVITGIENDIPTVVPALSDKNACSIAKSAWHLQYAKDHLSRLRYNKSKLFIYIDKPNEQSDTGKAKLVYVVSFYATDFSAKRLLQPVYFIDANNGKILKQYDNVHSDVGTGPGGNDITGITVRSTNYYQFGNAIGGLPSLGFLPVQVNTSDNTCTMETNQIRLHGWNNIPINDEAFPVLTYEEPLHPVFNYSCTPGTNYINTNDGSYAPVVNHSYSAYAPSNDTFYFAQQTYQMLQTYLPQIINPWGHILPIRVYSHVGVFDNAFAITPYDLFDDAVSSFNPQFIVGNGDTVFYPLTDSETVAHELSHIFTAYHSNLIYEGQSGAINEAYSDMVGQTFDAYLKQTYPWYGFTWNIGDVVSLPNGPLAGKATRYMSNPPLDGYSIDNAANYRRGLNVHFGSGVYNKAFYLMVEQHKINIFQMFVYFSNANANYWTPDANYYHASCGVMQEALDQGNKNDFNAIVQAFKSVGVKCKVGLDRLTYQL